MNTKRVVLVTALLVCGSIAQAVANDIQLNAEGLRYAQELINSGHVIADRNGAWRDARVSAKQENEFIRVQGWSGYAKWHLAIDPRHPANSKARYKFPFGDFQNVRRSALIAIRSRARQYGYTEIEKSAAELQRELAPNEKCERGKSPAGRR